MKLTYKELSQVLAALRHWQDDIGNLPTDTKRGMFPHFDDVSPMTNAQIDKLCEKINCTE